MKSYFDKETQYMSIFKLELYPDEYQYQLISSFIYANNIMYNEIIDLEKSTYEEYLKGNVTDGFLGRFKIGPYISERKRNDPFLNKIPLHILRGGGFRAVDAYSYFFRHINNKPTYKILNKYSLDGSYSVRADRLHFINDHYIKTEGIATYIKTAPFNLDKNIHVYNPIIKRDSCNRIWLTFAYVKEKCTLDCPVTEPIGIDIGFRLDNKNTFVCSNGMIFCQPDTSVLEYNIGILDKKVHEDNIKIQEIADSKNISFFDVGLSKAMLDRRMKLYSLYQRLHNIKDTFYKQTISHIVKLNPKYIVIEELYTRQLEEINPFIDFEHVSVCQFRRLMENKCNQYNIKLYIVDNKMYPSSKICSNCKSIYEINRCTDNYNCPVCGLRMNRDLNAAINLKNYPKDFLKLEL